MKYDITKKSAPKMPSLGTGTKRVSLLLSRPQNSCEKPLVPILTPLLCAKMGFQKIQVLWLFLGGKCAIL